MRDTVGVLIGRARRQLPALKHLILAWIRRGQTAQVLAPARFAFGFAQVRAHGLRVRHRRFIVSVRVHHDGCRSVLGHAGHIHDIVCVGIVRVVLVRAGEHVRSVHTGQYGRVGRVQRLVGRRRRFHDGTPRRSRGKNRVHLAGNIGKRSSPHAGSLHVCRTQNIAQVGVAIAADHVPAIKRVATIVHLGHRAVRHAAAHQLAGGIGCEQVARSGADCLGASLGAVRIVVLAGQLDRDALRNLLVADAVLHGVLVFDPLGVQRNVTVAVAFLGRIAPRAVFVNRKVAVPRGVVGLDDHVGNELAVVVGRLVEPTGEREARTRGRVLFVDICRIGNVVGRRERANLPIGVCLVGRDLAARIRADVVVHVVLDLVFRLADNRNAEHHVSVFHDIGIPPGNLTLARGDLPRHGRVKHVAGNLVVGAVRRVHQEVRKHLVTRSSHAFAPRQLRVAFLVVNPFVGAVLVGLGVHRVTGDFARGLVEDRVVRDVHGLVRTLVVPGGRDDEARPVLNGPVGHEIGHSGFARHGLRIACSIRVRPARKRALVVVVPSLVVDRGADGQIAHDLVGMALGLGHALGIAVHDAEVVGQPLGVHGDGLRRVTHAGHRGQLLVRQARLHVVVVCQPVDHVGIGVVGHSSPA